jgi:glycosyltransferase involved in cell wall biosynthesis
MKKILLINTNDTGGGAAIACRRLMDALSAAGADVRLLVLNRRSDDARITAVDAPAWLKRAAFLTERLEVFTQNGFSRERLFQVSTASLGFNLAKHPLVAWADVIHLHWINHGLLSTEGIGELIATGKPVVWTMHDLWPLTGICHYPGPCLRYEQGCGFCPLLKSSRKGDLSERVYRRKEGVVQGAGIRFVGCSAWIADRTSCSLLAEGNCFANIPNPIDLHTFAPGDRDAARRRLGLPLDKKLILFGAVNAADKRKGIDFIVEASQLLAASHADMELLMCGRMKGDAKLPFALPVRELGFVGDTATMVDIYRAADLFLTPSLEDNLPNMIMEAMACGTPCVGFHTGGIPEMITHELNGYVARQCDAADLAQGIERVLAMPQAGAEARRFVEANYAPELVARRYLDLYNEISQKQ